MSSSEKEVGAVTQKYLKKYPKLSSWGLARKLKQDNPLLFTSPDQARSVVRYYRQANGEGARKSRDGREKFERAQLPEAIATKYEPYQLPAINDNCLVMSDIHFPFQDNKAIELAVNYGFEHSVNTVILLGDVLDFYDLSKFSKEPNLIRFREERELFWRFVDFLNDRLPSVQIFWYEGNHEKRFEHYMKNHAAEVFDVEDFKIPELFNLRELGVTWIAKSQFIKAGKLNLIHGHEDFGRSSVNPARWLFLKAKDHAVTGHFHQVSDHAGKSINGNIVHCWSIGCMCNLNPEYMPLNEWQQGFGHLHIFKNKTFVFKNKVIVDGEVF